MAPPPTGSPPAPSRGSQTSLHPCPPHVCFLSLSQSLFSSFVFFHLGLFPHYKSKSLSLPLPPLSLWGLHSYFGMLIGHLLHVGGAVCGGGGREGEGRIVQTYLTFLLMC